jgi:hypothetical protein
MRHHYQPRDCWICGKHLAIKEEVLWVFPNDHNGICGDHADILNRFDIKFAPETKFDFEIKYEKFSFSNGEYKRKFEPWRVKQFLEKIGRGLIRA